MRKIYRHQLDRNLKYYRKIHIYHGLWLVSWYAKKTNQGDFPLNLRNILHFPLSFILFPLIVIDWSDE